MQSKRKRLMYLFIKDLSSGICGEVLANKAQRDALSHVESTTYHVSATAQVIGWLFIFFMNLGMLLYIYLFAMSQSQSRQSAWFQSFVIWVIFEIFFSSTGLVFFFHLLVPLYVLTEVSKIKEKVLLDLILFREKYLRRLTNSKGNGDQRDGTSAARGVGGGADPETGGMIIRSSGQSNNKDPNKDIIVSEFNAAKYLFASWRVASIPYLPSLISRFDSADEKINNSSQRQREEDSRVIEQT
jgi:hypothetical protein